MIPRHMFQRHQKENKRLRVFIDTNDPDFTEIEIVRLGTDERKIFIPKEQGGNNGTDNLSATLF